MQRRIHQTAADLIRRQPSAELSFAQGKTRTAPIPNDVIRWLPLRPMRYTKPLITGQGFT